MTATEIRKNKEYQPLSAGVQMDISDVKYSIMASLEILCSKVVRTDKDQRVINLLIQAAKKLPIYIEELNKYC